MAQTAWHTSNPSFYPRGLHLPRFGFRPPSQEAGLAFAIAVIVGAVVFLQLQGIARPRAAESPGIGIEATGALPAVPPPALIEPRSVVLSSVPALPLEERPAIPAVESAQPLASQPTSIRDVDIAGLLAMRNLVTQTGLSIDPALVSYGEVAGLGDIAMVPMQSGGSGGTLAIAVLAMGGEGPQVLALLTPDSATRGRMRVSIEGGQIVASIGLLGPEDPLCCPSQTKRIYYYWNGARLLVDRQITSQNAPSAKD